MFKKNSINRKSKKFIGFEAKTTLSEMLDIVIPWVKSAKEKTYIN